MVREGVDRTTRTGHHSSGVVKESEPGEVDGGSEAGASSLQPDVVMRTDRVIDIQERRSPRGRLRNVAKIISGRIAVAHGNFAEIVGVHANEPIVFKVGSVDRNGHVSGRILGPYTAPSVVYGVCVDNKGFSSIALRDVNAVVCEAEDI